MTGMTQPHYIDREAVGVLIAKLRAVESSREPSDWSGIRQVTTNWYRNPDGPDAADMIEALFSRPPMEAVAWRYPVLTARDEAVARMARAMRNGKAWPAVFQANTAEALAEDALTALEALAVIPTEGLGSFSQAKIPTEGQPTSNSHIQTGDKNDRP